MSLKSELDALFALAIVAWHRNFWIEREVALDRQSYDVIELHAQVRKLQFCGQQFLFRLERLCPALDKIHLKSAAVFDLFYPLSLLVFNSLNFCLDGAVLGLDDEDPVVKLANSQGNIVLNSASLSAACLYLGACGVVSGFDLKELGKRLDEARATGEKVSSTLIQDEGSRRESTSQCAGRNLNQLSVRHVGKTGVIPDRRQVRASGNFFGVLLFLDVVGSNPDHVIVLQGQFDGFVQIDLARRR
jgi:hypothetical protein